MPHSGQLRLSADVNILARRVWRTCAFRTFHNYQGLIFPQSLFAEAGGTHPPPNLTTNLKEKR